MTNKKEITQSDLKEFLNSNNIHLEDDLENEIFDNFENLKNLDDFDDFKNVLIENYDSEIIGYNQAMEYLQENDRSLKDSLRLADEFGYSLKNLHSEILASLLVADNFSELVNDSSDDLEAIYNYLNN